MEHFYLLMLSYVCMYIAGKMNTKTIEQKEVRGFFVLISLVSITISVLLFIINCVLNIFN